MLAPYGTPRLPTDLAYFLAILATMDVVAEGWNVPVEELQVRFGRVSLGFFNNFRIEHEATNRKVDYKSTDVGEHHVDQWTDKRLSRPHSHAEIRRLAGLDPTLVAA